MPKSDSKKNSRQSSKGKETKGSKKTSKEKEPKDSEKSPEGKEPKGSKKKNSSEQEGKYSTKRQAIVNFFIGIVVVIVAVVVVFFYALGISRVDGDSMLPTLTNNQTLVFNRLDKNYNRGDIIAIAMPNGDYYVKRVIGIEGDVIDIANGKVSVNGNVLNEPYIQGNTNPVSELVSYPLTVKPGKVFALGDNREHSTDSREIGQVSFYAIQGKIIGGE